MKAFALAVLAAFLLVGGLNRTPSASALEQEVRWPLAVSEDRRHMVDAGGKPFLLVGDTAWSLLAVLSKKETLRYLDDRAAKGFNAILVNLIEHRFSPHEPPWRNAEGALPFPDPDNFSRIEESYFRHVDWVVARAHERGIALLLLPAYIGINCGEHGWCAEMRRNGAARLRAYGEMLGRRYDGAGNVVWVHGGDHTPADADLALVMAIRDGILAAGGGRQLHLYHWNSGNPPSADLRIGRIDVDTLYSYATGRLGEESLASHERNRGRRPFIFIEGTYENEHRSAARIWREQFYATTLSGGSGFVFGNFPIWAFSMPGDPNYGFGDDKFEEGWPQALDGPGSRMAAIAARLFKALDWWNLLPDPNGPLVKVEGPPDAAGPVATARSPDGKLSVSYLSGSGTIRLDAARLSAPVTATWFEPSTGFCTGSQRLTGSVGRIHLDPPGRREDGSDDWLLILETVPSGERSSVCR